jgi:hypothetical protein
MDDSELDLVWGVAGIGKVIKRSPRQTHYLLAKGAILAAMQIGSLWCADRKGLIAQFRGQPTGAKVPAGASPQTGGT